MCRARGNLIHLAEVETSFNWILATSFSWILTMEATLLSSMELSMGIKCPWLVPGLSEGQSKCMFKFHYVHLAFCGFTVLASFPL